jgi:hypothetical protein
MIDPKKIEEWDRLAKAASPGPWEAGDGYEQEDGAWWVADANGLMVACPDQGPEENDARFIAAARVAVPALLDEVERLRGAAAAEEAEVVRLAELAQVRQGELDLARSALSAMGTEVQTLRWEARQARRLAAVLLQRLGGEVSISLDEARAAEALELHQDGDRVSVRAAK